MKKNPLAFIRSVSTRTYTYAKNNKVKSTILLVIFFAIGWYAYGALLGSEIATTYNLARARVGTLSVTVSGAGQVSSTNQVELKPKASGDIVALRVVAGQEVKRGAVIAILDSTDARKTVRDAEISLTSAKLSLQKQEKPAETLSLIQSENALFDAVQANTRAQDDLISTYDDTFTSISNAFLNLPTVMTGVQDILYKASYRPGQDNISYYADLVSDYAPTVIIYRDSAAKAYQEARASYDATFLSYKEMGRFSSTSTIEKLAEQTYLTAKAIAESVKNTDNLLSFVKDKLTSRNSPIPTTLSTHQTSLATYTNNTNSTLNELLGSINGVSNAKDALGKSARTVIEKTESLAALKAGTDELDLASTRLTVAQRENALQDAKEKLNDYVIVAPFDGTIASIDVSVSDSVSSGSTIATLITRERIAEIDLNEVDAVNVKAGQNVTLTFDALEDVTLKGTVVEIDTLGAVSQGVVNYSAKISFATTDERIKPGMSVSTEITTQTKDNVILVPNAAIKSQGDTSYVEVVPQESVASLFAGNQNPGNQAFDMERGSTSPRSRPNGFMATSSGATGTRAMLPQTNTNLTGIALPALPERQTVVVGISNDTYTEIISGLSQGALVVTKTTAGSSAAPTSAAPNILQASGAGRGTGAGGGVRIPR